MIVTGEMINIGLIKNVWHWIVTVDTAVMVQTLAARTDSVILTTEIEAGHLWTCRWTGEWIALKGEIVAHRVVMKCLLEEGLRRDLKDFMKGEVVAEVVKS